MKSKISKYLPVVLALVLVLPLMAHAQSGGGFGRFFLDILGFAKTVIKALFPLVTAVLILAFGWQVFKYMTDKSDTDKEVHKARLVQALIALFIWFILFGLITVVANSLGINVGDDVGSEDITTVDLTP